MKCIVLIVALLLALTALAQATSMSASAELEEFDMLIAELDGADCNVIEKNTSVRKCMYQNSVPKPVCDFSLHLYNVHLHFTRGDRCRGRLQQGG